MQQPDKRNALLHHHTDAPSPSDGKCDPDEAAPLHQGLPQQCGLDGTTPIHQGLAPWCGHDITAPLHCRLQPEILEQVCRFIGTNVQKEDAQSLAQIDARELLDVLLDLEYSFSPTMQDLLVYKFDKARGKNKVVDSLISFIFPDEVCVMYSPPEFRN
ncbi:hypothetical protein TRIUR3_34352 [Triticum urartu]|uniref:Uncharacterized protein n=1 Tax=Triticum urartu TaxID=4572 RepID=M7YTU8_TRIUA|nr:hypothetical protein TRIUR3_34352 [Triticum urartu]